MKKRHIVLIIILIFIAVVAGIFIYERLHASLYHNANGISFSIIGQSDGPTAVFIAGKLPGGSAESTETAESPETAEEPEKAEISEKTKKSERTEIADTEEVEESERTEIADTEESKESKDMKLIINQTEVSVLWEDNAAVADLKDAVSDNQITIEMSMYGGFEQVGSIGRSLTRDDKQITTNPGDIVLYNGNQLVIFYGSNSWSYTKLGKVQNISNDELTELLSNGDVTINIVR